MSAGSNTITSVSPSSLREVVTTADNTEARAITLPAISRLTKWESWFRKPFRPMNRIKTLLRWIKLKYYEKVYVRVWIREGKTPQQVFELLNLYEGTYTLLSNFNFRLWSVFMSKWNELNKERQISILEVLIEYYGIEKIARVISMGRRQRETYQIADELFLKLLIFMTMSKMSTDGVYHMLNINEIGLENLLSDPVFSVWVSYFLMKQQYHPQAYIDMIHQLLSAYDEIKLACAFDAATKVKTTGFVVNNVRTTKYYGEAFQNAMFDKWYNDNFDPKSLLQNLKSNHDEGNNVDLYRKYQHFFNVH